MKKVLVMAAALGLFAAPAFAASSIVGSKHDMTQFGNFTGSTTEVCVFCHTPHGANSPGNAPLWNRTTTAVTSTYNSATLDQTNSAPSVVSTAVANSDAKLCLSCHDGLTLGQTLANPPNGQTATFNAELSGELVIGAALNNDHPIGMDYSAVQAADATGFNAVTDAGLATENVGGLPLYEVGTGVMWCSSCHDVHDDTNSPFLAADNAASALCTTCHNK